KIIRDADKIDIFKVVTDYYKLPESQKNPAVELNLKDTPGFSMGIIEDIYNFKNSSNVYIKNRNDIRLIKISWLFDINFNVSLKAIFERGYIEESFNALPQTEELIAIKEKVMKHIYNKIRSN
ncbi:MAG: hypothetical protein PHX70_09830, partial [Clostridium sp.]|nr:hypothetical protein [Clostridium sp.]